MMDLPDPGSAVVEQGQAELAFCQERFARWIDGRVFIAGRKHVLVPHLTTDVRAQTGVQDFVGTAPLNLVYVSNADHLSGVSREEQHRVAAADIGFIGQNVYLYCASEGLACVFRASLDTERLARTLRLGKSQFIMFVQTVGYPRS